MNSNQKTHLDRNSERDTNKNMELEEDRNGVFSYFRDVEKCVADVTGSRGEKEILPQGPEGSKLKLGSVCLKIPEIDSRVCYSLLDKLGQFDLELLVSKRDSGDLRKHKFCNRFSVGNESRENATPADVINSTEELEFVPLTEIALSRGATSNRKESSVLQKVEFDNKYSYDFKTKNDMDISEISSYVGTDSRNWTNSCLEDVKLLASGPDLFAEMHDRSLELMLNFVSTAQTEAAESERESSSLQNTEYYDTFSASQSNELNIDILETSSIQESKSKSETTVSYNDMCMADFSDLSVDNIDSIDRISDRSNSLFHCNISNDSGAVLCCNHHESLTEVLELTEVVTLFKQQVLALQNQIRTEEEIVATSNKSYEEKIDKVNKEVASLKIEICKRDSIINKNLLLNHRISELKSNINQCKSYYDKLDLLLTENKSKDEDLTTMTNNVNNLQEKIMIGKDQIKIFENDCEMTVNSFTKQFVNFEEMYEEKVHEYKNLLDVVFSFNKFMCAFENCKNFSGSENIPSLSNEHLKISLDDFNNNVQLQEEVNKFKSNIELLNMFFLNYNILYDKDRKICKELETAKESLKTTESVLEKANLNITELSSSYDKLNNDFKEQKNLYISKKNLCADHMFILDKINKSYETLKEEFESTKNSKTVLEAQLKKYSEVEINYRKLQDNYSLIKQKYDNIETEFGHKYNKFYQSIDSLTEENKSLKYEIDKLTNCLKTEKEKYNKLDENWQIIFNSLNNKIQDTEKYLSETNLDNSLLKKELKEKENNEKHFLNNFNKLLSLDEGLITFQIHDNSLLSCEDSFVALRQKLTSIMDLCKRLDKESSRAQNLDTECTLLNGIIAEKEKELNLLVKEYADQLDLHKESFIKLSEHNKELSAENGVLRKKNKDLEEQNFKLNNQAFNIQNYDYEELKNYVQELKLDLVDRDSRISSLKLHIESCCSYYREKAQDYRHELAELKLQFHNLKNKNTISHQFLSNGENGIRKFETSVQTDLTPKSIIERHKVKELEERILELEKQKAILNRLCVKRGQIIKSLNSTVPHS